MSDTQFQFYHDTFQDQLVAGRAKHLAKQHPRAADYISQAPVLVCVSLMYKPAQVWSIWANMCERGAKLGEMMDQFRVNRGLRHLDAMATNARYERLWGSTLIDANPSAIAQQLNARDAEAQKQYAEKLYALTQRGWSADRVIWFGEHMPTDYILAVDHVVDFMRSPFGLAWKPGWRWRDFISAMQKWEEDFAKQKELAEAKFNEPLSPHEYLPKEWNHGEFTFTMLNTENQLRREGAEMGHCVGGYAGHVSGGSSVIYTCNRTGADGKTSRQGTLEMGRDRQYVCLPKGIAVGVLPDEAPLEDMKVETRWTFKMVQFKSFRNSPPTAEAMHAASIFQREVFAKPQSEKDKVKAEEKKKFHEMMDRVQDHAAQLRDKQLRCEHAMREEEMRMRMTQARSNPMSWLSMRGLFGID